MDKSAGANVFPKPEVGNEVLSGRAGKGNAVLSTNPPGIFRLVGCISTGMLGMALFRIETWGGDLIVHKCWDSRRILKHDSMTLYLGPGSAKKVLATRTKSGSGSVATC